MISIEEKISALLDGYLSESEVNELLDELNRSPEHLETLGRYQRTQEVLHDCLTKEAEAIRTTDFSSSVFQAIQGAPAPMNDKTFFVKPLLQLAVAASVCFSVLLAWNGYQEIAAPEVLAEKSESSAQALLPFSWTSVQPNSPSRGAQMASQVLQSMPLENTPARSISTKPWRVDWLPEGFTLSEETPTMKLFSNGVTDFSVLLEQAKDEQIRISVTRREAPHYSVTLAGEIPVETAHRVLESVAVSP